MKGSEGKRGGRRERELRKDKIIILKLSYNSINYI